MDAPPVQYVRTSDGYDIAYSVSGHGRPLVMTLSPYFKNTEQMWSWPSPRRLFESIASRFTLVQFDHRGTGNSTRGLKAGHSQEHYQLDLEAVIERTGLNNFILFGVADGTHAPTIYASRHPARVVALILWNPQVMAWSVLEQWESLYTNSWDMFQTSHGQTFLRQSPYDRQSTTQSDFLLVARAQGGSNVEDLLPSVRMPTLVMATRKPAWPGLLDSARTFASLIPNTRLVLFDEPRLEAIYSESGPPAVTPVIEAFAAELPETGSVPGATRGPPDALSEREIEGLRLPLSSREIEVLRLLALGLSSREIATSLTLSARTVERHIANIYLKTETHGRAQATSYAIAHRLA
jgi:pimeloyl-ACP methyl ester carboxylesterase/DNA-binding CsgD family transcriptional regulator